MQRQKNHIILFVLFTLLLIGKTASAQLSNRNYEIEARVHYGYMYFQNDEYHSALGRYSRHTPSYEFSLHRNTYGEHRWEVLHNYPSIGFTFYYSGFGNDSISAELGKVFGLPKSEIDQMERNPQAYICQSEIGRNILALAERLRDFPRQRSIHAGGVLITESPITDYTALDLPPKGFPTTQYDMYSAEKVGLIKIDIRGNNPGQCVRQIMILAIARLWL